MKKFALGVVLLAALGAACTKAEAESAPSSETLTTVGTIVKDKTVDVGKQGPSVGDVFFETIDLKSQAGAALGSLRTQCAVGAEPQWAVCTGVYDITGRGQIVGTALVNITSWGPDFEASIIGGTGDFANARGVVHIHPTETGETDTLELLP